MISPLLRDLRDATDGLFDLTEEQSQVKYAVRRMYDIIEDLEGRVIELEKTATPRMGGRPILGHPDEES